MKLKKIKKLLIGFIFLVSFTPEMLHSQVVTQLSDEFLEGLPPSVREQIEVQNSVQEEKDLEDLFRSDTSIEKNKVILDKLRKRLEAVSKKINDDDTNKETLKRFGQDFFQTIQSSFMPINMPNIGSDYVVDVGDEFKLLLTGKISQEIPLFLERDGSILIPDFGKVFIAGKTLKAADRIVSEYLEIKSVGVNSSLTISKVRDIQVLMLGAIESKGIFTISGGSNILGALNVAGGISKNGSFRNIEIRRGGKTINQVDLYEIFVYGNFSPENTLRSGDTIFVNPAGPIIPVTGGVNFEALYEINPGESAEKVIEYAGGFANRFEGFNYISIDRVGLENIQTTQLDLDELPSFTVLTRDSIRVPSYENSILPSKEVALEGMVKRPGKYFITENETLSSLIRRAGGYKENAYSYGAALFRNSALMKEQSFAQLNYADTVNYIVSNIGKPNRSVNSSALDLLAEELRSQDFNGRVITDFNLSKIENNPSKDILLHDKDRIVIPRLEKIVYLFGDFKNSSNLSYDPELSVKDYVKKVGGLKKSAFNEIIVIDPDGTTHLFSARSLSFGNSVEIYPGSIIYAPRDIGKLSGVMYASTVSPILSSLALSLASLNSISD